MSKTASTMTAQEVDADFSAVELRFHSYYKFTFTFVGTHDDGRTIEATYGGNAGDIYKYGITAGVPVPFVRCDEWRSVKVYDGSRVVFDWCDQ